MPRKPVVVLHMPSPEAAAKQLGAEHPGVDFVTCDRHSTLHEVARSSGACVVYTARFAQDIPFTPDALKNLPALEWVAVAASGTDHLGLWDPYNLMVTNCAGVAADMMAQYVLGTMLHFSLNLDRLGAAQRRRAWQGDAVVHPIAGRTALVVGLGATGTVVARRLGELGMQVLGVRARPQITDCVEEVHGTNALASLLPRADYVVLAVPLTARTRGMFGKRAFGSLKPGAVLINVARGGVVDEAAMLGALQSGALRGAAIDVFETEPLPEDSPLWSAPGLLITPHCSSVYPGWEKQALSMFSRNLGRFLRGDLLTNIVDPARGY